MRKIAFYVEGQTEQFFINKLIVEMVSQKNHKAVGTEKQLCVVLQKFQGKGRIPKDIYPQTLAQHQSPTHYVLIHDCSGDEQVKSQILTDYQRLFSQGYSQIIGVRDLYPFPIQRLQQLENELNNGNPNKRIPIPPLPKNSTIIVAVREIEDWFLAECNHYAFIDSTLNMAFISSIGFDPCADDLTIRSNSAADDLKSIYKLAGKTYNKTKNNVERTVECLDYTNIYFVVRKRIAMLNGLINKIDNFLI